MDGIENTLNEQILYEDAEYTGGYSIKEREVMC